MAPGHLTCFEKPGKELRGLSSDLTIKASREALLAKDTHMSSSIHEQSSMVVSSCPSVGAQRGPPQSLS